MNRVLLSLITLFFFHSQALGKELNQIEKLAVKYAEVVGEIELGNVAFSKVNKLCKTKFKNSPIFLYETDYYLRQNTGYTLEEFVQFLNQEKETDSLATQIVDELIQQNGGCNNTALEHWSRFITSYNEENHLPFLRQNEIMFGLPNIVRNEKQVKQEFQEKLKLYKHLPYQELFDLALALEDGSYRYSAFGLSQSITKNKEKALEIWRFAIEKYNEPQAYFYIGKLLQNRSIAEAFTAFEQSAKQGYIYGKIWLGTYYACNKDALKAEYWLDIAKTEYKDPEYIDDIFAEIEELGMPTNCMDGWVY